MSTDDSATTKKETNASSANTTSNVKSNQYINVSKMTDYTYAQSTGDYTSANDLTEGYDVSTGSTIMTSGDDILKSNKYRMYDYRDTMQGLQPFHAVTQNMRKIVNFKQDYIVIIRKKLFFAANAQQNTVSTFADPDDAGTIGNGNYVRSYRIDNFTSISTNLNINGSPGSCSLEMKGGERIICYEEYGVTANASELAVVMGEKELGTETSSTNSNISGIYGKMILQDGQTVDLNDAVTQYTKAENGNYHRVATYTMDKVSTTEENKALGLNNYTVTKDMEIINNQTLKVTTDITNSTTGQTTTSTTLVPITMEMNNNVNTLTSNKVFVEKCDFEPMDEVWVWGKSNFERDGNGDFKYNQIFFGYINEVKKNYSAGKSNGLMVQITASDQLKLLDLSYVTMKPSMVPGAVGANGLDIRYSYQDRKAFGTFELFNPFTVYNAIGNSNVEDASAAQKETLETATKMMTFTNVFAGVPVYKIIKTLCLDSGIPTWYLSDRIEPILFPPYTYMIGNTNSDQLLQAPTMSKRLQECNNAKKKLLLEFFADEEGNIVLKCPNYALGVNTLVKNNMGFSSLAGGMLGDSRFSTTAISEKFSLNSADVEKQKKQLEAVKKQTAENTSTTTETLTDAEKEKLEKTTGSDGLSVLYSSDYPYTTEERQMLCQLAEEQQATNFSNDYSQAGLSYSGTKETAFLGNDIQTTRYSRNGIGGITTEGTGQSYNGALFEGESGAVKNITLTANSSVYKYIQQYNNSSINAGVSLDTLFERAKKNNAWLANLYGNSTTETAEKQAQYEGQTLVISYNEYATTSDAASALKDKFYASRKKTIEDSQNKENQHPEEEYINRARSYFSNFLSEYTDSLIPEIPQEYIISFSLSDTDREIYNMYQVNIEGDFTMGDPKGGGITTFSRVFPDIKSMLKFGVRPAPQSLNFPYMGNRENAHMLGYMLTAISLSRRMSATLSMIEDSYFKIGNPVRLFTYDEHPYKPIARQMDASATSSSLNVLNEYNSGGTSNNIDGSTSKMFGDFDGGNWVDVNNQTKKSNGTTTSKSDSKETTSTTKTGDKVDGNTVDKQTKQDGTTENSTAQQTTNDTSSDELKGEIISTHGSNGSDKNFVKASDTAKYTNAQSIYYVESISRSIGPNKESTMSLTMTCGRMMGQPSNIDFLLLLYKTYYDTTVGYSMDLVEIAKIQEKYKGNTNTKVKITDDNAEGSKIAKEAGYDIKFQGDKAPTQESSEQEQEALPSNAVEKLCTTADGNALTAHNIAKEQGWKYLTKIVKGSCGKVSGDTKTKLFGFTYYIYDDLEANYVYIGKQSVDGAVTPQNGNSNNATETWRKHSDSRCQTIYNSEASKMTTSETSSSTTKVNNPPKLIIQDYITATYTYGASMDTKSGHIDEQNENQLKWQEFIRAMIALNENIFGNNLNINYAQVNSSLQSNIGKTLTLPNSLIVDKTDNSSEETVATTNNQDGNDNNNGNMSVANHDTTDSQGSSSSNTNADNKNSTENNQSDSNKSSSTTTNGSASATETTTNTDTNGKGSGAQANAEADTALQNQSDNTEKDSDKTKVDVNSDAKYADYSEVTREKTDDGGTKEICKVKDEESHYQTNYYDSNDNLIKSVDEDEETNNVTTTIYNHTEGKNGTITNAQSTSVTTKADGSTTTTSINYKQDNSNGAYYTFEGGMTTVKDSDGNVVSAKKLTADSDFNLTLSTNKSIGILTKDIATENVQTYSLDITTNNVTAGTSRPTTTDTVVATTSITEATQNTVNDSGTDNTSTIMNTLQKNSKVSYGNNGQIYMTYQDANGKEKTVPVNNISSSAVSSTKVTSNTSKTTNGTSTTNTIKTTDNNISSALTKSASVTTNSNVPSGYQQVVNTDSTKYVLNKNTNQVTIYSKRSDGKYSVTRETANLYKYDNGNLYRKV